VWLAASLKFLIPCSVLIALGGQFRSGTARETTPSGFTDLLEEVSQPFTPPPDSLRPAPRAAPAKIFSLPGALTGIWLCGFLGIAFSWWIRWRRIRAAVRSGVPLDLELPLTAVSSPTSLEPGIFGIARPVLLLPEGISERLTRTQLKTVIAHELCHVSHRDNLVAAIHMFVETVFWFHPLIWWIGKRMVEERERACDEEVLRVRRGRSEFEETNRGDYGESCDMQVERRQKSFVGRSRRNGRGRACRYRSGECATDTSAVQPGGVRCGVCETTRTGRQKYVESADRPPWREIYLKSSAPVRDFLCL